MSRFDKTVNSILNRLIFEQIENEPSGDEIQKAEKAMDDFRQSIKNEYEKNPEQFLKNADNGINAFNYVVDGLVQNLSNIENKIKTEVVTEEAGADWMNDITSKVSDYVTQFSKTAGGYINGSFEKVLDFATDQAVEKMPSIIRYVIGDNNYNALKTEVDAMDDGFWYKAIAIFEPTGIMSWPYLNEAKKLYEEHLGQQDEDIYTLNLLAAAVAVIPGVKAFKIFSVPFKILRPLTKIFGGARAATIASSVARELKLALNIEQKGQKAFGIASKTGRLGEWVTSFFGKIFKPVKAVAKLAASAAKAGTIASGGDIPKMVDDWIKKGAAMTSQVPQQKTFTRIPSFQRISTQSP